MTVRRTRAVPVAIRPMSVAAALERSMIRLPTNGPRSLILTCVARPFARFFTFSHVSNGSRLCAAVISFMLYVSPLLVFRPWYGYPYQLATPT